MERNAVTPVAASGVAETGPDAVDTTHGEEAEATAPSETVNTEMMARMMRSAVKFSLPL
jgi:hypothetical protein